MRFSRDTILVGIMLSASWLSSCGGNGNPPPPPPPAALVISTVSLPAGTVDSAYSATLQATGGAAPYSWAITAGTLPANLSLDGATGVISGTPGAAGTTSLTVAVTDSETPAQTAAANLSLVINSVSGNALLQGNYAFLFSGFFNGYFTDAGSFVADGAGNITNGIVDTNGLSGPTTNGAFTGTYSLASNNIGTMTLVFTGPGAGTSTFAIAVSSDGTSRFIEFDSSGVQGSGIIKKQTPSDFSAASLKGNYAFGLTGINGPSANRMALIGAFASDGVSSFSNGLADGNNNGSILSDASLSASYTIAPNGRGTATLTVKGIGTLNASLYVVSAGEFLLMETDSVGAGNPLLSGDILQQTGAGSFSNTSLGGQNVFETVGVAASNPPSSVVTVGLAVANPPGTLNLSADVNSNGAPSTESQTLSYSVAPNGRVTTSGNNPPVLHLSGAQAFVLFPDNRVTCGVLESQSSGPFTNGSLTGSYEGGSITLDTMGAAEVDLLSFDGQGNLTETFDSSSGSNPNQGSRTFTYTTASSGRTVLATPQNANAGILYIVSPTELIVLETGPPSLSTFGK